mgnify:CR=1 FL=1
MTAFNHTPQAFLYGYVQTETAGYRRLGVGASIYTVASTGTDGAVFPTYLTMLSAAINTTGWSATLNANGSVTLAGPSLAVNFYDSLGLLLGMPYPPGTNAGTLTSLTSTSPSPACIPLYGAEWTEIEIKRSVKYEVSRFARTHGYIYGGARLYTWRMVMNREALNAVRFGWVLRTKIRIQGAGSGGTGSTGSAIGSSNPSGYLDGYPLGIQSVEWIDSTQQIARVTMAVVGGSV